MVAIDFSFHEGLLSDLQIALTNEPADLATYCVADAQPWLRAIADSASIWIGLQLSAHGFTEQCDFVGRPIRTPPLPLHEKSNPSAGMGRIRAERQAVQRGFANLVGDRHSRVGKAESR